LAGFWCGDGLQNRLTRPKSSMNGVVRHLTGNPTSGTWTHPEPTIGSFLLVEFRISTSKGISLSGPCILRRVRGRKYRQAKTGQPMSRGSTIELREVFGRSTRFSQAHLPSPRRRFSAQQGETYIPTEKRSGSRCIFCTRSANAGHYLLRFVPAKGAR